MRYFNILFLVLAFSTSTAAFSKDPIFTCDKYSGKTLEKKARHFNGAINHAARQYGVNSDFIKAVITVETCFRPNVRGTSGERGLMQLLPSTARRLGVSNSANSWQNIHAGTKYLKFLLKRFGGNKHYAAAAYNGGPGAVSHKTGPRFKQVRRYSSDVMRAYHKMRVTPSVASKGGRLSKKPRKKSKTKFVKRQGKKSRGGSKRKVAKISRRKGGKKSKGKYRKKGIKTRKNKTGKKSSKRTRYYRVKKGQSLSHIAKRTGVSVKRLKKLNSLKSSRIRAGQKLKLR